MKKNRKEKASYNNPVFKVSAIVIAFFTFWGALSPNSLAKNAQSVLDFTSYSFGWFYLVSVAGFVAFCIFLAVSKYGKIKLGNDDEKPEFSLFTWISMLFSAGFGVGIVFWGVAEPLTHFTNPPLAGVQPQSEESARLAMRYSFFNWGIHQWSVFTIVGLALAYFQFRKKSKSLVSETLEGIHIKRGKESLKKSVNILAVIATVIGVSTSLGMGILQINGGLNFVFSVPNNAWMQTVIVLILLVLYLASATTGLHKGIKFLSNTNMLLVLVLMTFFLFKGPTVFIMDSLVLGIGDYLQNFAEMSFFMTPYSGDTWVQDWTVFYWAWVIAWSPFVGSFVARISRGRTIREFVVGVLVVPPGIAFMWMAIFGGTGLYMDLFQNTAIAEAVSKDVTTAVFVLLQEFPLYFFFSIIIMALILIFLVTSADSAVFVLGMMTSGGSLNPSNTVKMIWGVLMAGITIVLIISSGLTGLQAASLVSALPFTLILIMISLSLYRSLRKDRAASQLEMEHPEQMQELERKAQ